MASFAFRHQAWRGFEHALDPLGTPRALADAKLGCERDLQGLETPVHRESESFASEAEALQICGRTSRFARKS
jgi:hypothetical protein